MTSALRQHTTLRLFDQPVVVRHRSASAHLITPTVPLTSEGVTRRAITSLDHHRQRQLPFFTQHLLLAGPRQT